MQAVISAENDEAILNLCTSSRLQTTATSSSLHSPDGLETGTTDNAAHVPSPTLEEFVRRLTLCDGPLACHAIQGCLYRHVRVCATAVGDGDTFREGELEECLLAVLDTIMDCLSEKGGGNRADVKRLRCAVFLLQLLSTLLKSERGASHPERSNHQAGVEAAEPPAASTQAALTPNDQTCSGWETVAAQACAQRAYAYLDKMVRQTTTLVLGDQNGDTHSAGFWVLSLLADVLKGLRKGKRSCGHPFARVGSKRKHYGDAKGPKVASPPFAPATAVVVTDGIVDDDGGHSPALATSEKLDVSCVAEAVAAFPVEGATVATDVALKWLEVMQLLMEIAETRCQSLLAHILFSVPPTLTQIASQRGSRSLLLQEGPSRPPGAAFVEARGADDALAQAMLTLVFRMVRVGGARGSRHASGKSLHAELIEIYERRTEEGREGGEDHAGQAPIPWPWRTAAEALAATAAASADLEGSSFGFAGRLVRLFSDQDDALVDMLLTNLDIFHDTRSTASQPEVVEPVSRNESKAFTPALKHLYGGVLHPGILFAALLSEVRFESGLLLDWLISPETSFLRYVTMLLRFAVAEWPQFAARVAGASVAISESRAHMRTSMKCLEENEGEGEEEEEEEELFLSEEEADRLGKSVSCLSGLLTSARALEKNGLVPYNLAPLLRRIGQVVSLYEDCGDAEEGA